MPLSRKEVAAIALTAVPPEGAERTALYLNPDPLEKGSVVTMGRRAVSIDAPCFLGFLDLKPDANWSHPCRYLLIDAETGQIRSSDANFPPAADTLQLVHRGSEVEDWMLLTERPYVSG